MQAWRKAVSNAKAQFDHQQNRLMNLEVTSEEDLKAHWLEYNQKYLEPLPGFNNHVIAEKKRKVDEINYSREQVRCMDF